MSLADACRDLGISGPAVRQWLLRNSEQQAEISALLPKKPGLEKARQNFDAIINLIAAGDNAETACRALGVNWRKFHDFLRDNPDERARFVAATDKRERGPNAKGTRASPRPRRVWTDDDFERALALIAAFTGADIDDALGDDLPSRASLERSDTFKARFYEIMGKRAKRREAARPPQSPTEPWGLLLKACLRSPIYAAAWRYVKGYEPVDRDDIISTLVLSVLEGERSISDIGKKATRRSAVTATMGYQHQFVSLDRLQHDDDEAVTLGDTISNDDQILFY